MPSSSIWFLFLGLMTRPQSYLCIVFCLLHPLSCLLLPLPIYLDRAHPLQRDRVESAWPLKFLELLLRDFVSRWLKLVSRWLKRRWPRLRFSHQCSLLKQPERYRSGDDSYHTVKTRIYFCWLLNSVSTNESTCKRKIYLFRSNIRIWRNSFEAVPSQQANLRVRASPSACLLHFVFLT